MSKRHLTAAEASARLNISPASLYAYVSRGLLRSEAGDGPSRARHYLVEDVDQLRSRKEARRDPNKVAQKALHWGSPVLDSAITKIDAGELYYRGERARELARTKSVEEVASLIWRGAFDAVSWPAASLTAHDRDALRRVKAVAGRLPASEQFEILLPLAAARDETAFDLRPVAVARTGARIVRLLTESVCGQTARNGIARALARRWAPNTADAERLISAALILCADHELNVSAFTARVVASGGSTPYSVVAAGLHALSGVRHGGESLRVEAMLHRSTHPRDARTFISTSLRSGERVAGFGHQLYPDGDPRAQHLLEALRTRRKKLDPIGEAMIDAMFDLAEEHPTIDFALVMLTRALDLPQGSPLTLFALGRSIGFIGHAIEQYETGEMIRPRARYAGR
ncbi:MAG: citrate synthase [Vicinamibacteria bacterium]